MMTVARERRRSRSEVLGSAAYTVAATEVVDLLQLLAVVSVIIASVGSVQFEQPGCGGPDPMNAHCQSCDWSEPWMGMAMVAHAMSHGQCVACVACAAETFDWGLPSQCWSHSPVDEMGETTWVSLHRSASGST